MITIKSNVAPALLAGEPFGFSSFYGSTPKKYRRVFGFLPVMWYTDPDTPYSYEEVPVGIISRPNSKVWGELRDHDVFHCQGQGTVDLSVGALALHAAEGVEYLDPYYLFSGYDKVRTSGLSYWGENETRTRTYAVPSFSDSVKGISTPFNIVVEYGVRYEGDYAYIYTRMQAHTCYWSSAAAEVKTVDLRAYVLKRVKNAGSITLRYSTPATVGGTKVVHPVTSVQVSYTSLQTGLSSWFKPTGAAMTVRSMANSGVTEADIAGKRNYLVARLTSPGMVELISRLFASWPDPFDHGELTADLLAQQRYVDANLLLTAYELRTLQLNPEMWKNFTSVFEEAYKFAKHAGKDAKTIMKGLRRLLKKGSGNFLGHEYGILPTARDGSAVLTGLSDFADAMFTRHRREHVRRSTSVSAGLGSTIISTHVLTVEKALLPRDFLGVSMEGIYALRNLGLWPSWEMAWDFVPFSFVVDRIRSIQEAAEDADTIMWAQYYPVTYCIQSTKRQWTLKLDDLWPDLGLMDDITLVMYSRWCSDELPLPPIKLGDVTDPREFMWAEATALVLVRS